jgi:hypothetical protein
MCGHENLAHEMGDSYLCRHAFVIQGAVARSRGLADMMAQVTRRSRAGLYALAHFMGDYVSPIR